MLSKGQAQIPADIQQDIEINEIMMYVKDITIR
jgi:hypothetical protein